MNFYYFLDLKTYEKSNSRLPIGWMMTTKIYENYLDITVVSLYSN
jgi:hypothetical protein